MDNGSQSVLTIERPSQGGYLITRWEGSHSPREILFAASKIDEALNFIRDKMLPIPSTDQASTFKTPTEGNVSFSYVGAQGD